MALIPFKSTEKQGKANSKSSWSLERGTKSGRVKWQWS